MFDLDFGEIYHRRQRGKLGAIVLRLDNQTVEAVNHVVWRLFSEIAATVPLERPLVVLDDERAHRFGTVDHFG
jgi:hypothetical protein